MLVTMVAAAAIAPSAPVWAQDAVRAACWQDIQRLCPRELAAMDRDAVRACLREKIAEASDTCRTAVRQHRAATREQDARR